MRASCGIKESSRIRRSAFTLLMVHPLMPTDASRRAYCPARVKSARTPPFSKKIDGPAYPRSIVPFRLSHSSTQRIETRGWLTSSRAVTFSPRAILLKNANTPYKTPRSVVEVMMMQSKPRTRRLASRKPSPSSGSGDSNAGTIFRIPLIVPRMMRLLFDASVQPQSPPHHSHDAADHFVTRRGQHDRVSGTTTAAGSASYFARATLSSGA